MITAGLSRSVAGLAAVFALITAKPALALKVDYVDIQPSTNVKIGDEITITATLINDTGQLGSWDGILCAEPEPTCNQPSACGHWGQYSMFPDMPGIVAYPVPTETQSSFDAVINGQVSTQWKFTATRTGTVSFGVMAAQPAWWIYEGCSDPASCGATGLPWDGSTCGLGPVTITSDLNASAEIHCISPGGRPPVTAFPGDDFVVVLSLTNGGTTDAKVEYAACAKVVGDPAAFTLIGSPTFPVTITPTNSACFIWTYHVNANASVPSSLSFRTDANRILADTNTLDIIVTPAGITVTMFMDPDGPGGVSPAPFGDGYHMAQDEITVYATLTNQSPDYDFDIDPTIITIAEYGMPGYTQIGSRDPAPGPVSLNKFTSREFTWKYGIDRSQRRYGYCEDPGEFQRYKVMARGAEGTVYQNVRKDIAEVSLECPVVVQTGRNFSVTVWVTSLSDRTITLDPSGTVFLDAGTGKIAITSGPSWIGARKFNPGETLGYVYGCSPVAPSPPANQMVNGGIRYDMVYGTDTTCISAAPVNVAIIPPSPFTATFTPNVADVNSGHWYQLKLTVTNDSKCDSVLASVPAFDELNPSPFYAFSNEVSGPFLTDCTPPCTLAAGTSTLFFWSVTTTGCGDANWTGTGTGDDTACGGAGFIFPFTSDKIRIRQPARLTAGSLSVSLPKSQVVLTRNFDVVLTVVPAGENDIKDFEVKPEWHGASGASVGLVTAAVIPGILPGCGRCVTDVCPDKSRSFTWTFSATGVGTGLGQVWFTFTINGTDSSTSDPVGPVVAQSQPSQFRILKPSILSAAAVITHLCDSCGPPVDGCGLRVELTVGVDGDTSIAWPYALSAEPVSVSGGAAILAKAPVLDGTPLPPGKAEFDWYYAPDAAGSISFTMSIVGTESELGGPVFATATTAPYTLTPPSLVASASVYKGATTGDITVTTAPGQSFKVIMKIENQGDVPVDSVTATTTATGSASCVGSLPVALPVTGTFYAESNLPGGQLKGCKAGVLAWTFVPAPDPDGVGIMAFSVTLTGIAHDAKNPMSISAHSMCVTIIPPPVEARLLSTSVPVVMRGGEFEVTVQLTNQRLNPVTVAPTPPVLSFSNPELRNIAPSWATVSMLGGATTTVIVKARVLETAALGQSTVSLSGLPFAATDPISPGVVAPVVATGSPLTVLVATPVQASIVSVSSTTVYRGEEISAIIELVNASATPLTVTPASQVLAFSRGGLTGLTPVGSGQQTIAPGGTVRVTARIRVEVNADLGPARIELADSPFTVTYQGGTSPISAERVGGPVDITIASPIRARLVAPAQPNVVRGTEFDMSIDLVNGAAAMTAMPSFPILSFTNPGITGLNPPPPGIETLAAGATKRVTTRAHVQGSAALGPAVVSLTATPFTAVYSGGGTAAVPVTPEPDILTINVIPAETGLSFGENPYHVLQGCLPVHYVLPEGGKISIKVYSITGEMVRTILDTERPVEERVECWDGRNDGGQMVAAGLYLVRFETRKLKATRKLAVIK